MATSFLDELFDSPIKVRLLKLFLRNQEQQFTLDEISTHIQADASSTRYQLRKLRRAGLLNSHLSHLEDENKPAENASSAKTVKSGQKMRGRKRRVYFLNKGFSFLEEIQALVLDSSPVSNDELLKTLNELGKIKLTVLTGVFVNNPHSRVDLLVVGEGIDRRKFRGFLTKLESDVGKELRYTLMESDEFRYRWGMFDNYVHKIFREEHETVLDLLHLHK